MLILGEKNMGVDESIENIIYSAAYTNSPREVSIIFCDPLGTSTNFQLPHIKKIFSTEDEIIQHIEKHMDKNDVLSGLNVVIIKDIDLLLKKSANYTLLTKYIDFCKKNNICLIVTTSYLLNIEKGLINKFNTTMIFKMHSFEESSLIFNNSRGIQLFGLGDGYIFEIEGRKRIQLFTISDDEKNNISKIVNEFFN
jgi:hypothetical protein